MKRLVAWLRGRISTTGTKVAATYVVGALLVATAAFAGLLGPVLAAAGWVAVAIGALAAVHAFVAWRTLRGLQDVVATGARIGWLEKLDASILAVGFLGKLYGIAQVTLSLTGGSGAQALAGVALIATAVGTALYATMLGLGVSLWVQNTTLILTNAVEQEKARHQEVSWPAADIIGHTFTNGPEGTD